MKVLGIMDGALVLAARIDYAHCPGPERREIDYVVPSPPSS